MRIVDLGVTHFLEAYGLQRRLVNEVTLGLHEDSLLLTEHRPVITIGRKGSWNSIRRSREFLSLRGIEVLSIDRGGDVTYHGPGQLVAYPIFRLKNESRDIHNFLRFLEKVGNYFLTQYGLVAEKMPGLTGIWIKGKKIGSIGIGIKKWVTYHGIALNINISLEPFSFITPCGIEGVETTSLKDIMGREIDIEDAKDKLKLSFDKVSLLAEADSKV
ncbi:MAG: lipoyl(octanoyl) transferase LipB [Candidatus Omnitrophota bacterium]